jgi:phytoene synthase
MQDVFAQCQALVREADRDRFLATLFAPAQHRGALLALYAFNAEIARVRDVAHQPMAGEIRLQWWREVLSGERAGEAAGHPVAAAVAATFAGDAEALRKLDDLIEARRFDLYDEPMPTLAALDEYAGKTASTLFAIASRRLDDGAAAGCETAARPAGLAYAYTGLLRSFGLHASRGQLYVPLEVLLRHQSGQEDVFAGRATPELADALAELRLRARAHLDDATAAVAALSPAAQIAFLPLALVRPALDRMDTADHDVFRPAEIPQWRRQWSLWRAAKRIARTAIRAA